MADLDRLVPLRRWQKMEAVWYDEQKAQDPRRVERFFGHLGPDDVLDCIEFWLQAPILMYEAAQQDDQSAMAKRVFSLLAVANRLVPVAAATYKGPHRIDLSAVSRACRTYPQLVAAVPQIAKLDAVIEQDLRSRQLRFDRLVGSVILDMDERDAAAGQSVFMEGVRAVQVLAALYRAKLSKRQRPKEDDQGQKRVLEIAPETWDSLTKEMKYIYLAHVQADKEDRRPPSSRRLAAAMAKADIEISHTSVAKLCNKIEEKLDAPLPGRERNKARRELSNTELQFELNDTDGRVQRER